MNLLSAFGLVIGVSLAYFLKMGLFGGLVFTLLVSGLIRAYFSSSYIRANSSQTNTANNIFLTTTFEVLGNLSKSKGVITPLDIDNANSLMRTLGIHDVSQQQAQQAFVRGKQDNYPLAEKIAQFRQFYQFRPYYLNLFLDIQISHVLADGILHANEERKLNIIAQALGFNMQQLTLLLKKHGVNFNQWNNNNSSQQQRYADYHTNVTERELQEAYYLLKVKPSDDALTIKRAYRRLMSQYHPDKIVASGASPVEIETANKKAQTIQVSYQLIKQTRNDL